LVKSKEKSIVSEELENKEPFQIENSVQINLFEESSEKVPYHKGDSVFRSDTYLRNKYITKKNFPKLKLISYTGQLSNNIYIVLEGFNKDNEKGLYILDQHAASERVNKEYFYELLEKNIKSRQKLISPLNIEVNPSEKYFLQDNLGEIKRLGFDFDHFGGNTFVLREVPTIFGKVVNASLIKDIITDISEIGKDKSFSDVKEAIINYLACHRSIRGGEDLTLKDIRDLLLKLSETKDPYHCAHGRPILRFLSFKELDKLFKRT
jgi:DNA mismatch repair protein MutL